MIAVLDDRRRRRVADFSDAELEAALIADCELQGACAAVLGRRADENRYRKGTAARRAWARGLRAQAIRELRNTLGDETIRRKSVFPVKHRPGRGGSRLGPRSEWSARQKAAALAARHQLSNRSIGRLLGKSRQAVANQFHRIDRAAK